ncbi:MAG: FHA domain-containing protein [Anaerolineales bacterium]|nr:FHA domain-containing protein [Anaerolineales bacterium]
MNISTHRIHTSERKAAAALGPNPKQISAPVSTSWLSLHIIESGQIIPLAEQTEFTLGRVAEGQPIVPDIDLSPYNAYANGVSRLHCAIKLIQGQVYVVDLGSSNGTYLNGMRLTPYTEMPVTDGDIIYLGQLKIQLLIAY